MKDNSKYLLCIDSSGKTLAVAVMKDDEVLSAYNENTGLTHSCTLMPKIVEMIEKAKITVNDIDYFACANGPGSFTGLRIGIAAMKGLCNVTKKKMVEVSVLDGLEKNVEDFDGVICPVIDARRKEVYTAIYENKNKILDDCNIPLTELFEKLKELNKPVMFLGDGTESYKDFIKENMGELCFFAPLEKNLQNAVSVGKCALEKIKLGDVKDYNEFCVSYLKPSQPEMQKNIVIK